MEELARSACAVLTYIENTGIYNEFVGGFIKRVQ